MSKGGAKKGTRQSSRHLTREHVNEMRRGSNINRTEKLEQNGCNNAGCAYRLPHQKNVHIFAKSRRQKDDSKAPG
eukprot:5190743-Pleurochrysis_carterae.AAC.4